MSFDVLQEKIIALKNPTVAGLDPKPEYVPEHIRRESYGRYGETLEGAADAVLQFNKGLIDALCDIVPAVKPQSAYYERLGWHGMIALEQTIRYAHEKGMYVIADIKRGDIGWAPPRWGRPCARASVPTASPSTATWGRTASTPS